MPRRQPTHRPARHRRTAAIGALTLLFALGSGAAQPTPASTPQSPFDVPTAEVRVRADEDFTVRARALAPGRTLVVEALELDRGAAVRSLRLTPVQVFSQDARIIVHEEGRTRELPAPATVWLRGEIVGEAGSTVIVAFHERSGTRGLAFGGDGRLYTLAGAETAGPPRSAGLVARPVDVANELRDNHFACGNELLPAVEELVPRRTVAEGTTASAPATVARAASGTPSYWARVAIETDNEYLARFSGDTTAAAEYAGDLIAYASARYEAEVDTGLYISQLTLWQTPDPWSQTGSTCALYEFGAYWNANHAAVERTLAHFLSGKSARAGIAWVGVLCDDPFNLNIGSSCSGLPSNGNYGGDYGLTGGIDGTFDIANPSMIWDIVAVTHELGHNFNSPHTHCYANLGGNTQPIDRCYGSQAGCYAGATSLPGAAGTGSGTIMSYCHFHAGLFTNIGWSLGTGHPWGVAPDRVPARMGQHVVASSLANPGCLTTPPAGPLLIVTKAGSGEGTVASSPAGIDCGVACGAAFDLDDEVKLTATAATGSVFIGWSGNCTGASALCELTMSGPRDVTATFADASGTCMHASVSTLDIGSAATYASCSHLEVGSDVAVTAAGDAWFAAGRTLAVGNGFSVAGTLRISTCDQNLCFPGPGPSSASCHPCVAAVCAVDASCCDGGGWDAACVDLVGSVCGLTCQ